MPKTGNATARNDTVRFVPAANRTSTRTDLPPGGGMQRQVDPSSPGSQREDEVDYGDSTLEVETPARNRQPQQQLTGQGSSATATFTNTTQVQTEVQTQT
jgi:hypothetical protein